MASLRPVYFLEVCDNQVLPIGQCSVGEVKTCTCTNAVGVLLFRFSKDSNLHKKWIKLINKANWTSSDYRLVCSMHLDDHEIEQSLNEACT